MSPAVLSWDLRLLIGLTARRGSRGSLPGYHVLPCQGKTPAVLGDAAEMLVRTGKGCATFAVLESLEVYRVNILRTSCRCPYPVPGFQVFPTRALTFTQLTFLG